MTTNVRILPGKVKTYVRGPLINSDQMLNPPAAWLTTIIIDIQAQTDGLANGKYHILEVGVFKGNFISLLDHASRNLKTSIIGVDPFVLEGQDIETVKSIMLEKGCDFSRIELIKGFSYEVSKYVPYFNEKPADIIHVDGSHKYQDVYDDMKIVDPLLSNAGVLIMDDFLKSRQLEVLEAVMDYLKNHPDCNVVPLAVSGGKLFLCRPEYLDFYKEKIIAYSRLNMDIGSCYQLIDNIDNKEKWRAFQNLINTEIIVF